jgi:hypothetical protein
MYLVFCYSVTGKPAGRTDCVVCSCDWLPLFLEGGEAMCSTVIRRETIFFSSLFFSFLVLLFSSAVSMAQAGPKYDPTTEAKFKGTIEDLKVPPKGKEQEIEYLTIKDGTDTLDIYLCPKSFVDDMGVSFAKGDEIAFTGSKVKQGDTNVILAKEVVKGTDTLVLRDDKGNPVWNWKH